jgi:hypothetical protein
VYNANFFKELAYLKVEEKKIGILTKGNPVVPIQRGRTIGKFLRWRISQEFLVGNKGIRHILQPEHGNKAKKIVREYVP